MSTTITRERLSFWVGGKEYVEIEMPEALRDAVNAILDYTETYETPEQAALDAVLEAAFDGGEVEPEVLVALAKPWVPGKKVVVGDIRSHEGLVYKATKEHVTQVTQAVKGTLDETGYWVAYKAKIKEE